MLLYLDSGAYFIESIDSLVDLQKSINQDIIPFYDQHLEKTYTKMDCLLLLNLNKPEFLNNPQIMSGFIVFRKSIFSINFINEWLKYIQDERIVTDIENTLGVKNYKEFKEHRHDQSIFSLLCKKYNLQSFPDPTQFGNKERSRLKDNRLKQIFHHTKADKKKKTINERLSRLIQKIYNIPFRIKKIIS